MQIHHIKNSFPNIYKTPTITFFAKKINLCLLKNQFMKSKIKNVGEVTFIGNASVLCILQLVHKRLLLVEKLQTK